MSTYKIFTDSACDMTAEMAEELGITIIPLKFAFGDQSYNDYPDHREMSSEEFFEKLKCAEIPTTSAPSVGDYCDAMRSTLEAGEDILIISFCSALSSTYQSAIIASRTFMEEFPERKIRVGDTLSLGGGQVILLEGAVEQQRAGKSIDEVRAWVEAERHKIVHFAVADDLNYLRAGGRISTVAATFGGMLNIKPLIHVLSDGRPAVFGRARGHKAAFVSLIKEFTRLGVPKGQKVYISHANCLDEAAAFGDRLMSEGFAKEVVYTSLGPVLGTHLGPGTIAVFMRGHKRG